MSKNINYVVLKALKLWRWRWPTQEWLFYASFMLAVVVAGGVGENRQLDTTARIRVRLLWAFWTRKCGAFIQLIFVTHWPVRKLIHKIIVRVDTVDLLIKRTGYDSGVEPATFCTTQNQFQLGFNTLFTDTFKQLCVHILSVYENLLDRFWSIFNLTFVRNLTLVFVKCQLSSIACSC